MRSLSIKRLTAAAVGTAMVTSALSAGLAVNTQGDVTSFVQNVKANLNNVEVVAGTNGADISDGIQAAKLAAVLATLNYEEAEGLQMVPDTSGVSLSDKTVKVSSTGGGATVQPTTESFPVVYSTAAPYGTYNYYRTDARSATLTPDTLPGVLSRTTIYAEKTDGTTEQKTFEEQIIIDSGSVQYSENTNPDGHGLYLNPGGKDKLHYKLDFAKSGTGFYANHSVYEEVPEITILGHTYGIDTEKLEDDEFALYSGEKVTLSSGDEYETSNGYTVKINLITEGGSVTLTVTSPEGSTKTKKLNAGNGFDFFTNEVSVFVQSAAAGFTEQNVQTGIATLRIGTGSLDFEQGDPFPLDPAWKVNAITFSGSVPDRYLQSVDITYGMDSDDAFEKGDFDGSVKKGLASGAVIAGPKNADGDSLFDIQLIGFGGTTSVDTTAIKFESFGNDDYQTMHVWYTDPDGLPNAFTPDPEDEIPDWSGISSNGDLLNITEDSQFFINDKVFYFKKWETSGTGSTAKMYPVFTAGGKEGIEVKGSEIAKDTATTGTFQLDTVTINGQTISCTYETLTTTDRTDDRVYITHHGTTCDVLPDDINVGMEAVMDAAITAPVTMDLRYIGGAQFDGTGETGVDTYYFPTAMLWEANSTYPGATSPILIIADKHTERGWKDDEVGILAGIGVAATVTNASMGDLNLTGFTPFVNTPAVEASSSSTSNIVENLYEITSYGSYFSADGVELEVTVPEAARTTVVKVAKTLEETESTEGTSMYTLSEGDTLGAMTVEEINAEITGLDSISCGAATGMVYTKATAMDPTDLVTTDTAARATYQIVVGGPYVNRIAQAIDTTGLTTTGAGAQYLIASDDGMKVLAAGYTASDTVAAVNELINLLQG